MEEEREKFKDSLEIALQRRVAEGDTTAIIFGLKTLCKDRGYVVDRVEVNGRHRHSGDPGGEPIKIVRIVPAPSREQLMGNGSAATPPGRER